MVPARMADCQAECTGVAAPVPSVAVAAGSTRVVVLARIPACLVDIGVVTFVDKAVGKAAAGIVADTAAAADTAVGKVAVRIGSAVVATRRMVGMMAAPIPNSWWSRYLFACLPVVHRLEPRAEHMAWHRMWC